VRLEFAPDVAAKIVVNELQRGGKPAYLIAYFGAEEASGSLTVTGNAKPRRYDLEDGRTVAIACERVAGGWRIPIALHPHQTLALQLDGRASGSPRRLDQRYQELLPLDGPWEFTPHRRNAHLLRNWSVREGGEWKTTKPERLLLDHPGEHRIRAELDLQADVADLALAFESEIVSDLGLNGQPLRSATASDYFDHTTQEVAIADAVRRGVNVIEATLHVPEHQRRNDSYGKTTLTPIFALGAFAIRDEQVVAPPARLAAGDWSTQGLPAYSGTATYRIELDRREIPRRKQLWLSADVFDGIVEVRVNGRRAGTRCWAPYLVEIGAHLRPGRNRIELAVTNTLVNLIEKPAPSGLHAASLGMIA
jgi:hypothetical protein